MVVPKGILLLLMGTESRGEKVFEERKFLGAKYRVWDTWCPERIRAVQTCFWKARI